MNKKLFFILMGIVKIVASLATPQELPLIQVFPENSKNLTAITLPNQAQIISAPQLSTSGLPTIAHILNTQTGTQLITTGSDASRATISMRGFGDNAASNLLILLDGQPYSNPDLSSPLLNILSPAEITQLEILPTSSSVLYGDQAVGGLVNIITTRPKTKGVTATITYGSFTTAQAHFMLENNNAPYQYRIGGLYYSSHNYRYHNAEHTLNLFAELFYHDSFLRYRRSHHNLELPGKLSLAEVSQNPRQAENQVAYNKQQHDIWQLKYQQQLGSNWSTQLNSTVRLMEGVGAFLFNTHAIRFTEARTVITLNPQITGTINLSQYSLFPTIGIDLKYGSYTFNNTQAHQQQSSLYQHLNLPLTTTTRLNLGARYSRASYRLDSNKSIPSSNLFVTELEFSWQPQHYLRLFDLSPL